MPVRRIAASVAISLATTATHAAPAMWSPSPTDQAPAVAAVESPGERGFWRKLMFGDQAAEPQVERNALGQASLTQQTPRGWNPFSAATASVAPQQAQPSPAGHAAVQQTIQQSEIASLLQQAKAAESAGDLAATRRSLAAALSKNPNSVAALREIGHFEDRQDRLEVAEQMYRRAAAAAPQDAAVLNDLALCCARQGRMQESAAILANAVRLRPEKPLYRNNIAKVLVELDQPEAALFHLAAGHPPAVAQYNMGQLLLSKNDTDRAALHFRNAVAADPAFKPALDALAAAEPPTAPAAKPSPQPAETATAAVDDTITPVVAPEVETPREVAQNEAPRLLPPVR